MRVVSNKELELQFFGRIFRGLGQGELRHNIIKNIKINTDRRTIYESNKIGKLS